MLRYVAYRLAALGLPLVPPGAAYRLLAAASDAAYLLAPGARRLVSGNIRAALEARGVSRDVPGAARLAFRNLLWGYYELFRVPTITAEALRAAGSVEGIERLEEVAGRRPGAVIVFGHVGSLELMAQLPTLYPRHRFVVVVEHMPDERVFALFQSLRSSRGLRLVRVDQPQTLVGALRDGCNVILAGDVDTTGSGLVVDFFGRPARMPVGAVKLALGSGAPLLVVEGWRLSVRQPQRFHLRVSPPLRLSGSVSSRDDVRAGVQQLARRMEDVVAARPEQWLAFRRVWIEDV